MITVEQTGLDKSGLELVLDFIKNPEGYEEDVHAAAWEMVNELSDVLPSMSLSDYVKEAWHVVEPNNTYQHNWHIDTISDHLTAATFGAIKDNNLIINIQPRHMKSLMVAVFWPTWVWTFAPGTQWMFLSHNGRLSIRDNLKRRRIIRSDWYQSRWGGRFSLARDQSQKAYFENMQGGHMLALGLSGAIGHGADFIVADDLLNREHAYSEKHRDNANQVWNETASTRGNNPKTVVKVMMAQRLHNNDPPGNVMQKEQEGGEHYDRLIIPTEYEPDAPHPPTSIGWTDPRTKPGELLWEARYGPEEIRKLKVSLGSMSAAAQLQQRAGDAGGQIFKLKHFRFWKPAGWDHLPQAEIKAPDGRVHRFDAVERPLDFGLKVNSWDAAFKDATTSSYVVGQAWGIVDDTLFYLLDQFRSKLDFTDTLREIKALRASSKPHAIYIEDKANGPAIISSLKSKVQGVVAISPKGSKESRARAASPTVEAGQVFFPHPALAPWVEDLCYELLNFPSSVYNDQVDAMVQVILKILYPDEQILEAGVWG